MPSMKLGKKLLLSKKAWKSFTSTLQTKLRKLKRSKSIKKAKTRLNSTLSTILGRRPRRLSPPSRSKPTRSRIQTRPTATAHHSHEGFSPVFVDELFKEPVLAPPVAKHGHEYYPSSTSKVVVGKAASGSPPPACGGVKTPSAKAEKLDAQGPSAPAINGRPKSAVAKAVVATAPRASAATAEAHRLRGVDARAEQFILQFKEEMRLQRQRSFREYQEMLARGVM